MPSFPRQSIWHAVTPGSRAGGRASVRGPFRSRLGTKNFTLSGITKDSTGAALAGCTVRVFRSGDNSFVGQTISDGSGVWSFTMGDNAGNFYAVAYKAGAPDVTGATRNDLQGV